MTRPVLRTARLELRPLTMDHIPHLVELDADPEVLRFLLGRARTEQEACDFWGPVCADAYADHLGLGFWAGFAASSDGGAGAQPPDDVPGTGSGADSAERAAESDAAPGEFLGWWSLAPSREDVATSSEQMGSAVQAEAGWRLRRRHWRRGLAAEGARAVFEHGFSACGLQTVWAETMAVNVASRGVMRRLGMRHLTTEMRHWEQPLPGAEQGEAVYEITRAEWTCRAD